MRKKILSLALALAMCLGLTIPVFAATEPWTRAPHMDSVDYYFEEDGIFVTIYLEGSTLHINYTGSGTLNYKYAEYGIGELVGEYCEYYGLSRDDVSDIAIGIGPGIDDDISDFEEWAVGFPGLLCPCSVSRIDSATPAQPQQPEQPQQPAGTTASPTNDALTLNGVKQNPTVFKLDGGDNYFKIRDLAAMLNGTEKQFAVGYDGSVQVTTGQPYEAVGGELAGAAEGSFAAEPTNDAIYIDGVKADLTAYKIEGNNFFRLRDLGRALDFYVGWTAERGVFIETDKPYAD
ncbi:hypothetical protein AALA54_05545 [Oscillospiraceae bacterium 44-34]